MERFHRLISALMYLDLGQVHLLALALRSGHGGRGRRGGGGSITFRLLSREQRPAVAVFRWFIPKGRYTYLFWVGRGGGTYSFVCSCFSPGNVTGIL